MRPASRRAAGAACAAFVVGRFGSGLPPRRRAGAPTRLEGRRVSPLSAPPREASESSSSDDEDRGPAPVFTWADCVRAQDAAGRTAPASRWSLCNYLTRVSPLGVDVRLVSARVTGEGAVLLWLEVCIGAAPAAADAASGDRRPRFRVQAQLSSAVIEQIGVVDAWGPARS